MNGFNAFVTCATALKVTPSLGISVRDNSSLNAYTKSEKTLQLHAKLHDASRFFAEYGKKSSGYSYALTDTITNFFWSPDLYKDLISMKAFKQSLINLLEC